MALDKAILVTGATGKQGGALIAALLSHNAPFTILAVTRNPESPSAQKLAAKSPRIKLVKGNLDDLPALFGAAKAISPQIWGVFSVQTMMGDGATVETEEVQGKALVDAALENKVEFFVYSSLDRGGEESYDNPTNVPHFASKYRIEHHLVDSSRGTNMKYTILRPVTFMDNFVPGMFGKVFAAAWKVALGDKPLKLIAASDIGFFGAKAFEDPEQFAGRSITLAGDSLTFEEAREVWKQKMGTEMPVTYDVLGKAFLWYSEEMGLMMKWFKEVGAAGDPAELRKEHPGLMDFGTWLEKDSKFASQT